MKVPATEGSGMAPIHSVHFPISETPLNLCFPISADRYWAADGPDFHAAFGHVPPADLKRLLTDGNSIN